MFKNSSRLRTSYYSNAFLSRCRQPKASNINGAVCLFSSLTTRILVVTIAVVSVQHEVLHEKLQVHIKAYKKWKKEEGN